MITIASALDLAGLQRAISGEVLAPGSPGYGAAHRSVNPKFDQIRPQAIVRCQSDSDVAETLDLACKFGVDVAARSGGHCFAGRSSTQGILIDLSPMDVLDVTDDKASVGAGIRLGHLYQRLDQHGVTLPAGCGSTVGIAGLALGGGIGVLGRKYGLTCDQLLAARVVLADGRIVECDDHHDADLFWALRGAGGGQFGVVTTLRFRTIEAPAATTFRLTSPYASAAPLIDAWQAWAPNAPEELHAALRITAAGEVFRPPSVALYGVMLGVRGDAEELLTDLLGRAKASPTLMDLNELPYVKAKQALEQDGAAEPEARAAHVINKSEFFRRPLPRSVIDALLIDLTRGRHVNETRELSFTPLGGAYNRWPSDVTAFVHRAEQFLLEHIATVPVTDARRATLARAWAAHSKATAHPWASGGVYPNFPDPDLSNWADAYHGRNYERLRQVKRVYDPGNLFHFDQSVPVDGRS